MKKRILVFILLSGFFPGCAVFDGLSVPAAVDTGLSSTHIRLLSVRAVSPYQWELSFDRAVSPEVMALSNYQISGGAVIEGVGLSTSSEKLLLFLSNQSPQQSYTLTVLGRTYVQAGESGDSVASTNGAAPATESNTIVLEGGSVNIDGFGHDDDVPPVVTIFYPVSLVTINQTYHESLQVVGFVNDETGIASVDYKVDNNNYLPLSGAIFNIKSEDYAVGTHRVILRATDLRGNTTARSVEFAITNVLYNFSMTYPVSPTVYVPGNSITVQGETTADNVISARFSVHSEWTNYAYQSLSSSDNKTWSAFFTPDWKDNGTPLFIIEFVSTNNLGQPIFTNTISNTVRLYDNAVYLSGEGSDANGGGMYDPVKSIGKAIAIVKSLKIRHIKIATGNYGGLFYWLADGGDFILDGGYSTDFLTQDRTVYPSVFNTIDLHFTKGMEFRNLVIREGMQRNGYRGLILFDSENTVVSNCEFTALPRGIELCNMSGNTLLVDNDIHDNSGGSATGLEISGGSGITIKNNRFVQNTASDGMGAGIYINSSNPLILSNIIAYNSASVCGGGVYITGGTVELISNRISENHGGYGGGVYMEGGSVVQGNIFDKNVAVRGGGIEYYAHSIDFRDNVLYDNRSVYGGGLLGDQGCNGVISNNIFSNNLATYSGGALHFWAYDDIPSFMDNLIVNNRANSYGGGISVWGELSVITMSFNRDKIIGNVAPFGGGIANINTYSFTYDGNNTSSILSNKDYGIESYEGRIPIVQNFIHSGNTPGFKNW